VHKRTRVIINFFLSVLLFTSVQVKSSVQHQGAPAHIQERSVHERVQHQGAPAHIQERFREDVLKKVEFKERWFSIVKGFHE
jgi:hypothetical protein